jgi:hypothetical protein
MEDTEAQPSDLITTTKCAPLTVSRMGGRFLNSRTGPNDKALRESRRRVIQAWPAYSSRMLTRRHRRRRSGKENNDDRVAVRLLPVHESGDCQAER